MRVQVILLTEHVCDGDAGQVFAPVALHGVDVEEDDQGGDETQEHQQEDADLQPLPEHVGAAKAEGGSQPGNRRLNPRKGKHLSICRPLT